MSSARNYCSDGVRGEVSNGVKVLVVTGSSGGHAFPAVGFLEALRSSQPDVRSLLIMPASRMQEKIRSAGFRVNIIPAVSYSGRFTLRNLFAAIKFIEASISSIWLVIRFAPDVVVGFGSIASLPAVLWAWFTRIRTVIHEQNVIPGRANRFLAIFVDRIAVSFPESRQFLKQYARKVFCTGNLLRSNIARIDKHSALQYFKLKSDKITVLVMGGSQGSFSINAGFLKCAAEIAGEIEFQVIHLTGYRDFDTVLRQYQGIPVSCKVFSFLDEMQYAYSASDICVCRSGATSIAELMYYELPAILIPYPFAYQHQGANANILAQYGCAEIIDDKDIEAGKLSGVFQGLLRDPTRIEDMRRDYHNFARIDSREEFLKIVFSA